MAPPPSRLTRPPAPPPRSRAGYGANWWTGQCDKCAPGCAYCQYDDDDGRQLCNGCKAGFLAVWDAAHENAVCQAPCPVAHCRPGSCHTNAVTDPPHCDE